jgi:ubiquinone/menaquinone biosynthesis C-methylase UbiE
MNPRHASRVRKKVVMSSAETMRRFLKGASLEIEDLFLLEAFQIGYLPGWVPERELAAVLWAYPSLRRYLTVRCPSIARFLERILEEHPPVEDREQLAICGDEVVWTIADLLVYNKSPEIYDRLEFHGWDFSEVTSITPLEGKIAVDGGAGTGRIALEAAQTARLVFAVEPVSRLRSYIRDRAVERSLKNLYVVDGFNHQIPFPDSFTDVLITSHAIGWQLELELAEMERVVRPGGTIIHCPGTADTPREQELHDRLISSPWAYEFARYKEADGWKRKYWKQIEQTARGIAPARESSSGRSRTDAVLTRGIPAGEEER